MTNNSYSVTFDAKFTIRKVNLLPRKANKGTLGKRVREYLDSKKSNYRTKMEEPKPNPAIRKLNFWEFQIHFRETAVHFLDNLRKFFKDYTEIFEEFGYNCWKILK